MIFMHGVGSRILNKCGFGRVVLTNSFYYTDYIAYIAWLHEHVWGLFRVLVYYYSTFIDWFKVSRTIILSLHIFITVAYNFYHHIVRSLRTCDNLVEIVIRKKGYGGNVRRIFA